MAASNDQGSAAGSIYFPDAAVLERLDKLVVRTGLTRNRVLVKIITDNLDAYERKPALLIESAGSSKS